MMVLTLAVLPEYSISTHQVIAGPNAALSTTDVNNREKRPNLRTATLYCATVYFRESSR